MGRSVVVARFAWYAGQMALTDLPGVRGHGAAKAMAAAGAVAPTASQRLPQHGDERR
jgi:hypothetical protein